MSYTIKELSVMKKTLDESKSLNEFIENEHLDQYKFMKCLSDLLADKIEKETKQRKKRIIKFIKKYEKDDDKIKDISGILDYLNDDGIENIIKEIFNTKKYTLDSEMIDFIIKDFKEFFNMFAQSTTLTEVLNTCK